jgi:hypothetical protein
LIGDEASDVHNAGEPSPDLENLEMSEVCVSSVKEDPAGPRAGPPGQSVAAGEKSPGGPVSGSAQDEKLRFETRLLALQLSRSGRAMEWLKAASVPVANLGAAITLYVGFGQINQADENRSADRFDKALSRLASEKANERITGVSGLRLFVNDSKSSLQRCSERG